jgi:hypothetical protein
LCSGDRCRAGDKHIDLIADQITDELIEALDLPFAEAVLDPNIVTVDVSALAQSFAQRPHDCVIRACKDEWEANDGYLPSGLRERYCWHHRNQKCQRMTPIHLLTFVFRRPAATSTCDAQRPGSAGGNRRRRRLLTLRWNPKLDSLNGDSHTIS